MRGSARLELGPRTLLGVLGLALVVAGLAMVYVPAALIVLGAVLLALAVRPSLGG